MCNEVKKKKNPNQTQNDPYILAHVCVGVFRRLNWYINLNGEAMTGVIIFSLVLADDFRLWHTDTLINCYDVVRQTLIYSDSHNEKLKNNSKWIMIQLQHELIALKGSLFLHTADGKILNRYTLCVSECVCAQWIEFHHGKGC